MSRRKEKPTFICADLPSKVDLRDQVADVALSHIKYPKTLDLRKFLPAIRNQGKQGSCSAQTGACIKEYQERIERNFKSHMSPQFLHNHRPFPKKREGSSPRSTMRNLLYNGICTEREYPYGKIERQRKIPKKVRQSALKNKIKNYAKIKTVEGLKRALRVNGVCYISVPVWNHGMTMWKPKKGDKKIGYHAMAVVGYTETQFIIRNSWSNKWGKDGYCFMPFADWKYKSECWTAFDERSDLPLEKYNRLATFFKFLSRIGEKIKWRKH